MKISRNLSAVLLCLSTLSAAELTNAPSTLTDESLAKLATQVRPDQGKYYAEVLRHAIASPAVKSFKSWGFTDASSWKADGQEGHPLLLDEKLRPKSAYLRQIEMLKRLATREP